MTLKEYCKEKKISARSIAENCHIPYSTVNDLLNGKTELGRASFGVISEIADFLDFGLDEFRMMFEMKGFQPDRSVPGVIIRNKRYFLLWDGKRIDLCKVTRLNKSNIEDIAEWTARDLMIQKALEEQDDLLSDARG